MVHKFTTQAGNTSSEIVNIQTSGYGTFTAKAVSGSSVTSGLEGRNSTEDDWHAIGDQWSGATPTAFKAATFTQMRVSGDGPFTGNEVFNIQVDNQ